MEQEYIFEENSGLSADSNDELCDNEELSDLLQQYHAKYNRHITIHSTVVDREDVEGSLTLDRRPSLEMTGSRISSPNHSEAVTVDEMKLNFNSEKEIMDQSYDSRKVSLVGSECGSRVKCEAEEYVDANPSRDGHSVQHFAKFELGETLSKDNSVLQTIKQELLAEHSQSPTSPSRDDLNNESDNEEFTHLHQQCCVNSSSHVSAPKIAEDREVKNVISASSQSDDSAKNNRCFLCLKIFSELRYLKRHIQRKHSSERQHQCTQCEKSYTDKSELFLHIKHVHTDTKYYCDMCEFSSSYSQQVKLHRSAVHLEKNGQKCPHCDSRFAYKRSLARHIKSIHTDKCHVDYSYSDQDVDGGSVHSREKPFACNLCDYRCGGKGNLTRHKSTAHPGVKCFSCCQCDFKTSTRSNLDQHLFDVHGSLIADQKKASPTLFGEPAENPHYSTVWPCEMIPGQEKLGGSTEDEDFTDQSCGSENSLLGGCESESRIRCKVEECADMSGNPNGKISLHLCAQLKSNENTSEDDSLLQTIKQESSQKQPQVTLDVLSDMLLDIREIPGPIQPYQPELSSDITTQAAEPVGKPVQGLGLQKGDRDNDARSCIKCRLCNRTFKALCYLDEHMQRKHLNVRLHGCTQCEKSFSVIYDLRKHVKQVHGEKKYKCDKCDYSAAISYRLKSHISTVHLEANSHKCPQCEKSFYAKSELTRHMKRVHGERIYHCDWCNYSFRTSSALKSHISAVHLEEKTHRCPECDSCFSHKGHLTQHINAVHNQEKPFECSGCDKRFSRRQYRDLHFRIVHCGDKPFSCEQCDYKCSLKSNLMQHVRSVHDKDKSSA